MGHTPTARSCQSSLLARQKHLVSHRQPPSNPSPPSQVTPRQYYLRASQPSSLVPPLMATFAPPWRLPGRLNSPENCRRLKGERKWPARSMRIFAEKLPVTRKDVGDVEKEQLGAADFVQRSRELVGADDGGPPRWFSPLESRRREDRSPLLLFLPGIDGSGLGLLRHHRRLGKIFDIWCLHIPPSDRTPFEGLVHLVEETVKSQAPCSPGRPIYLVGENLGACLALSIASLNPNIDLILVVGNPATPSYQSWLQSLSSLIDFWPKVDVNLPFSHKFREAVSFYGKRGSPKASTASLSNIPAELLYFLFLIDTLSKDSLKWRLKLLRSASLYACSRVHSVRAQTLILTSGKNQGLSIRDETEKLCRLMTNCRIRRMDCGHHIFLESDVDLVTVIKGAGFYRRSRQMDHVSDYLLPNDIECGNILKQNRWLIDAVNPVMLSTLSDGKIVKNLSGIPSEGPVIFVGYHMLMGWDLLPLILRLISDRGIHLRGIAHPIMFDGNSELMLPDYSSFDHYRLLGAVPASPMNLYKLLSRQSFVLLFPGGAREALHRKGEEYKLFWPTHPEFIRMAARFGATIVPFGAIGEDDISEMILDYDDLLRIPFFNDIINMINHEAVRFRTDSLGDSSDQNIHIPALLPKIPGRFYFLFGKPIKTRGREEELMDKENAQELYGHVKNKVESSIAYLKDKREKDPYRNILPRLLYQVTHGFSSDVPTFDL